MPITLPPIDAGTTAFRPTRRGFLAATLAAGLGLLLRPQRALSTSAAPREHRFALLSDTHIAADRKAVLRNTNMFDNLQRVCAEVTERLPSSVFIDGDLACLEGKAEDYATFVEGLKPLREAGLPIHLTLGNHDNRETFWSALPQEDAARKDPGNRPVEGRQAMLVETPLANWLVLDSLEKTNSTPGLVSDEQLKWLAATLDKAADKPALVMVHHNPAEAAEKITGLRNSAALMQVLLPRKQVKALFFGHTHKWEVKEQEGLHLVNFPPVAYVFAAGKPNGWVEGTLAATGMTLQLHCLDKQHAQHEQIVKLEWRS